jgi:DNA-binding transcriptional MerR regulator
MQNKHYYKIGEVCKITDLKPSVLRFWEREFKQLKPVKSNSRHRFYTQKHVTLINTLKHLLYEEKLTIEGAKRKLKEDFILDETNDSKETYNLKQVKQELEDLLNFLKKS